MTRANIVYKMYIGVVLDFYVTRTLQSTPRVGGHALSRAFNYGSLERSNIGWHNTHYSWLSMEI